MAFATLDNEDEEVMNEINMTPLVDVMLVLLIIFIITAPIMKHSLNVDLPRASSQPEDAQPAAVRLSIGADGQYFWNGQAISDDQLEARLEAEAARNPPPDFRIQGDQNARYQRVAQAMTAAQRAGVRKIGFVTDPAASK